MLREVTPLSRFAAVDTRAPDDARALEQPRRLRQRHRIGDHAALAALDLLHLRRLIGDVRRPGWLYGPYLLRGGVTWRLLPSDLPPKSTVWDYFSRWEWEGTIERIHHVLYVAVREQAGREATHARGRQQRAPEQQECGGEQKRAVPQREHRW